jgi:hypothetical protein
MRGAEEEASMPSLDGAFCGVGVAIDYLKVWQAPKSIPADHSGTATKNCGEPPS